MFPNYVYTVSSTHTHTHSCLGDVHVLIVVALDHKVACVTEQPIHHTVWPWGQLICTYNNTKLIIS